MTWEQPRVRGCFRASVRASLPWVPEVSRGPLRDLPAEGRSMSAKGRLTSARVTIKTLTETGNRARQTLAPRVACPGNDQYLPRDCLKSRKFEKKKKKKKEKQNKTERVGYLLEETFNK